MKVEIINHGSLVSFYPLDDDAREWWDSNVAECPMLGDRYFVEARYAADICNGINAELEEEIECTWCGGECYTTYANRRNELFCSKNHRDASNRALKRFLSKSEEIA